MPHCTARHAYVYRRFYIFTVLSGKGKSSKHTEGRGKKILLPKKIVDFYVPPYFKKNFFMKGAQKHNI